VQWYEGSVMVTGIVGPSAILFYDNPFRIPRAAAYFRIHIVLAVVSGRQPSLTILKLSAADISREGFAPTLLNRFQQVLGLLYGILCGSVV